jgi:hypothetical protein
MPVILPMQVAPAQVIAAQSVIHVLALEAMTALASGGRVTFVNASSAVLEASFMNCRKRYRLTEMVSRYAPACRH